jgi:hypothetical protein
MTTTNAPNGLADPTVAKRIERIIRNARPDPGCYCWGKGDACPEHVAVAIVAAMRAEELVVLTPEAADEILAHGWAETRRKVAEGIAVAIEDDRMGDEGSGIYERLAAIARKHREVPK